MRIATWNLNHRTCEKLIPKGMTEAINALALDVLVLTEYVPGSTREGFLKDLAEAGLRHVLVSVITPKRNHVLIAARSRLDEGEIKAPPLASSIPPSALHVILPDLDMEILGLRIPDYSKKPSIKRAYWDWILDAGAGLGERPSIILGDFNTDASYSHARCGDRLQLLAETGFLHALPESGWSYETANTGEGKRIDHAFVSNHFTLTGAQYVRGVGPHAFIGKNAMSDHAALVVEVERSGAR